jgi:hypothetical protein
LSQATGLHLSAVVLLALTLFAASPFAALAYDCVDPHCYNVIQWTGLTPGAHTYIWSVNPMHGGATSYDEIDNEQWLVDDAPDCNNAGFSVCWVEAGFGTFGPSQAPLFFYASRVNHGVYSETPLSASYPANTYTLVELYSARADGFFTIHLDNANSNVHDYFTVYSVDTNPDKILIGSELLGTSGSTSGQFDYWVLNQYAGLGPTWYYQFSDGAINADHRDPPSGNWSVLPSSNDPIWQGGVFYSYCPC